MVKEKRKKPRKIVLLKDRLDYIFTKFSSNFKNTGKNYLIKLAKDEKKIDYNNWFFETDDPVIKSFDLLENVGTLYDLLINLLNENENKLDSLNTQVYLTKIISKLKITIFEKIENITDKSEEEEKKKFFLHKVAF